MAYDRNDPRDLPRDERSRWRDERHEARERGYPARDERGFFDRAGDEIASWFGDDEAERRRREDQRMEARGSDRDRGWSRDRDWRRDEERGRFYGRDRDRERDRSFSERDDDRNPWSSRGHGGYERGYQPMFGGYAASESMAPTGYRGDPHYESWRRRQLDELDRDYDDYRRENQSRFESDFGSWRERRMHKRGLLGQIREHMELVGNDDEHIGTIDRTAGDRIILTKSDPESGGVHHSLSCSDIDRVEGDKVILDCSAGEAKQRWRDESRSRALFEREDQGEMGDRALNRSFEGTYR
jgi:hypothetical protein